VRSGALLTSFARICLKKPSQTNNQVKLEFLGVVHGCPRLSPTKVVPERQDKAKEGDIQAEWRTWCGRSPPTSLMKST
jgi:hypothetical protein